MNPTLALVMIVKNEAKGLENAIKSARPYVNEVVVAVDDCSNDKTLSIAKKCADVVKTYRWRGDFAWARNFAHEGVKSDYIIFLDGHEYIKEGKTIKDHLKKGGDGFLCTVELDNGAIIRNPRIYRNGIQFEGKVHELQVKMKSKIATDIVIRHDRLNFQDPGAAYLRDIQRDEQVPTIMGDRLKINPNDIRALFHLGMHCQAKGQFKMAIKYQKRFAKISRSKPEKWFMYFNMAFCHLAQKHYFRAWLAAGQADRETHGRWEVAKLRGIILQTKGEYRNALPYFVDSFKVNKCDVSYKPWTRDVDGTWNLIGECFFNIKEYFKASEAFKQGAEVSKNEKFKEFLLKRADVCEKMSRPIRDEQ